VDVGGREDVEPLAEALLGRHVGELDVDFRVPE
jgi:hypothetical protein